MTLASSGTYNFQMANSSIVLESFDRIGIRPSELTREHMASAYRSLNLELQNWSNVVPNLWEITLIDTSLVAGQKTYTYDASVQTVLDVYVSTPTGPSAAPIDRIMIPVSRSAYAAYPNKESQGFPTVYWVDRLIQPQITVWLVPDDQQTYTMHSYVMKQIQDAAVSGTQIPNIPNRFLEPLCARMAARLAIKYAVDKFDRLNAIAEKVYAEAAIEDQERAQISITPDMGVYQVN